jgi:hypothetical protein
MSYALRTLVTASLKYFNMIEDGSSFMEFIVQFILLCYMITCRRWITSLLTQKALNELNSYICQLVAICRLYGQISTHVWIPNIIQVSQNTWSVGCRTNNYYLLAKSGTKMRHTWQLLNQYSTTGRNRRSFLSKLILSITSQLKEQMHKKTKSFFYIKQITEWSLKI